MYFAILRINIQLSIRYVVMQIIHVFYTVAVLRVGSPEMYKNIPLHYIRDLD